MPKFESQPERLIKEKDKEAEDVPLPKEVPVSEKNFHPSNEDLEFLNKLENEGVQTYKGLPRKKVAKGAGKWVEESDQKDFFKKEKK